MTINPQNIEVGDKVSIRQQSPINAWRDSVVKEIKFMHGAWCAVLTDGWIALQGDGIKLVAKGYL